MRESNLFNKIDLHLIRVLHTVLTERSVSRAATRLGMHQPAVSLLLKRLRNYSGDKLLLRSGSEMVLTETALRMIGPAADILRSAEKMFSDSRGFEPSSATHTFRVAASDYLDPRFLPQLVAGIKANAPLCRIEIHPLSAAFNYQAQLAQGDLDVVIANWDKPPEDLHLGRLLEDEIVSLVSSDHPVIRRGWDQSAWLNAEHVAPTATYPGAKGVIDDYLESQGLQRNITVLCPHFGSIPAMVAESLLVLTTGRQYCESYLDRFALKVVACPIDFPRLQYYQLWHERSHNSASAKWLREQVKTVATALRSKRLAPQSLTRTRAA